MNPTEIQIIFTNSANMPARSLYASSKVLSSFTKLLVFPSNNFFAKEENADLYTAVDLVIDKVEHQIRKYKEKIQDHRKTPSMGELPKSL